MPYLVFVVTPNSFAQICHHPLGKFSSNAKNKISASNTAAVMWEIYQISKNLCRRQMVMEATDNDALISELQVMETHQKVK